MPGDKFERFYEYVAASATDQVLGNTTGSTRNPGTQYLSHLLIIPAAADAGDVLIQDGSDTAITVFYTGTLPSLVPFSVPIKAVNKTGAWQVTTGASVSVIAIGRFT
jgi:hypothetical protein